ncbi:hypothetical protein Pst134EB_026215 [Puccinia striiformis f. sp. tritici]|nr:hypothetical protein Pst134EB_026215 [Puccinia striiformis f. sp. tritici]
MIVAHLKDSAEAFWFNLASELDVNEMSWSLSKRLLRIKVLGDKCDTIDDHCQPLQEDDGLAKSGYYRGSESNYSNNRSFIPNHQRRPTNKSFSFPRRNSVAPATPVDLDVIDASKARCYNCNQIEHLEPDRPRPRRDITTKREIESHAVCKNIESTLSVLNPKALEFTPGAFRHGLIKELELNYIGEDLCSKNLKRKHTDSVDLTRKRLKNSDAESVDWLQLDSDSGCYDFELDSESDQSSIFWMGDGPPELELNAMSDTGISLPR